MEPDSDWRVIEPDETPPGAKAGPEAAPEKVQRWLIASIVAVVSVAAGLAIWATMPSGGVAVEASGPARDPHALIAAGASTRPVASSVAAAVGSIIVDVEGAVSAPGTHELPDGSRVGDAIAAAGGYDQDVDIAAAARVMNLAQKLTDGQQIRVPALGKSPTAETTGPASTSTTGSPSTALIDINHASADELDTLPGIGPVTAAKIVDARAQQPFATIDELQSRGVVGSATFEKLRDLITVTP